jgi:hypothetical protein
VYGAGAVLVRLADEGARVALALLALERAGSAAVGGLLLGALPADRLPRAFGLDSLTYNVAGIAGPAAAAAVSTVASPAGGTYALAGAALAGAALVAALPAGSAQARPARPRSYSWAWARCRWPRAVRAR